MQFHPYTSLKRRIHHIHLSRLCDANTKIRWLFRNRSASHMASLISNLTSTTSRVTLLRKQLHPKASRGAEPFLRRTTDFASLRYSSNPRALTDKASSQDEELVILGIETSCDDTAAAVVSVACVTLCVCVCFAFFFLVGLFREVGDQKFVGLGY